MTKSINIKGLITLMLSVAMIMAMTVFAFAETVEGTSEGQSFANAWEETEEEDGVYTMKYGFNKWLVYEDYVHTKHYSKNHIATLINGTNTFQKNGKSGKWAKIEVSHVCANPNVYRMTY